MHPKIRAAALLIFLGLQACSQSARSGNPQSSGQTDTSNKPVESRPPNTTYRPAFPGQTRAPGVHTQTAWEASVLTRDLKRPWGITVLPDGRLLITEKQGQFRIASLDGQLSAPIKGIPPVNDGGQGGLLDVALDPDFARNRIIYWSFAEKMPDGNLTAVGSGRLADNESTIENARVIYRATPAFPSELHYGSRLVFDREGFLFVSTGERSDKRSRPQAQQLNSALGKVLRITREGKPAPGNPLLNTKNALPEIYSYGHRNVQGLAIHPVTGALWESEMGPQGGDELNLLRPGKDNGWPAISYGIEYNGDPVGPGKTQQTGMEQPVYYWDPVLSPSGMTFYSSDSILEWNNNLFMAGLNSNHIARLVLDGERVTGEERLLADEGQHFRAIAQGKDGALYAITDEGRLYRIGRKRR